MKIELENIATWMQYVKENPKNSRVLDCFWPSQIKSKIWLVQSLKYTRGFWGGNIKKIVIFGGWYGFLSQVMSEEYPVSYVNVDNDPSCEKIFNDLNNNANISFLNVCMSKFDYDSSVNLVINTSSEHVPQEIYDLWWDNVPEGTKYVVQGNNFFESDEHVRCTETLEEFIEINHLQDSISKETLNCGMRPDGSPFYRFMAIGVK